MRVYGKNVIKELKNNKTKIKKIYLSKSFKDQEIINYIQKEKIAYVTMDNHKLNDMIKGNHQGIAADINDYIYLPFSEVLKKETIVMLDHLEDPHNFGSIIRTCECAGINTIIIPKDRSVNVNETVMRISSGALSYVEVCMVSNLNNAIKTLKENGFFIYGADMDGRDYKSITYSKKVCLIIGNEGKGIKENTLKNCDEVISIPMRGKINSLNASVSAGILIYHIMERNNNGL